MTFLHEHFTVDMSHNKLMERYLEKLVRTPADRDAVIHSLRTTGVLYSAMLQGAIDAVEVGGDQRLPDHDALARNAA